MRSSRSLARLFFAAAVSCTLLKISLPCRAQTPVASQTVAPPIAAVQSAGQKMPPAPPEDIPVDSQNAVRLSDVEGSVRLYDSGGKLFDQALQNMTVLPGMSVETGNDGRAELEFPDGSTARVTPNSALQLTVLLHGKVSAEFSTLKPTKGLTYIELSSSSKTLAIQVGPLTAQPVQTPVLLRVNLDTTPYQAALLTGTVQFSDDSGSAAAYLHTNETAKIDPAAASNYDIVQDLTADTWDAWNTDRDNTRAQIADAAHPNGENAGPGWNDLNYYGSWYDVPGQGMAWAPDAVGEDFDPYGSGAWSYSTYAGYGTAGYGWVSSYPWGWLPYHCGLWNYYQGNGWMWLPSSCGWGSGRGWYPYTQVLNAPYRYHLPSRPVAPTGIHHHPAQPLIAVQQGPSVHFRGLGEPRPMPRAIVISGTSLQPVPVDMRPIYGSVVAGGEFRSAPGSSGFSQTSQFGYMTGAHAIGPAAVGTPRITQAPRPPTYAPIYTPAPHISTPPVMSAPMQAPHMSAPAGHGH